MRRHDPLRVGKHPLERRQHRPLPRWMQVLLDLVDQHHELGRKRVTVTIDRARLRWLGELTGEPAPAAWAARFFVKWNRREMTGFEAFAQESEQRARAALDTADAAFRQRFRVPAKLAFPPLEVVWEDGRSDADRAAMPMPARKQ